MSADEGLRVSGGAGGTAVELEDLDHAATRLHHSAADLREAGADLHRGKSLLQGLDGVLADPGAVLALEGGLVAAHQELQQVAESTEGLAQLVAVCLAGYRTADEADRNRWAAFGAAVGLVSPVIPVLGWVVTENTSAWRREPPGGGGAEVPAPGAPSAVQQLPPPGPGVALGPPSGAVPSSAPALPGLTGSLPATADPQLVPVPGAPVPALPGAGAPVVPEAEQHPDGLTVLGRFIGPAEEPFFGALAGALAGPAALLVPAAPLLMSRASSSGADRGIGASTRTVVTPRPLPAEVAAAGAPTGVGDVLRRLEDAHEAPRSELRIRVERTVHADGSRSTIVYLPGTKDWSSGSTNPASWDAIALGMAGEPSAFTDAVVKAVEDAGVEADEPVMLAGYSLGGITAAQLAADPALRARFDVQGLVTAGSPIGNVDLPPDVQALSLEHDEDLVPKLEGVENTSLRSNQVTVTAPTPGQLGAHEVQGYAVLAEAVDASDDASLTAVRAAVGQFFSQPGDSTTVTEVAATRVDR
ncbi:hypothetical protein [Quadrisphaera setariae]|uniref:Alpha/beta hydrolase family protein n=1 Tax=Quadrisphaera setariae TaxID=2593304 RepID=A0A5C8ZGP6_9ACTN|nr:hypothetical protein [Quadrisphaera setariae]TXR56010.1 hypothetical protein FMM08_11170 [Quadrisphaera setariae]